MTILSIASDFTKVQPSFLQSMNAIENRRLWSGPSFARSRILSISQRFLQHQDKNLRVTSIIPSSNVNTSR